jgi:hypothetical protein
MTTLDNSFCCRSWTTLHAARTSTNPPARPSRKPEFRVRARARQVLLLASVPHASLRACAPPLALGQRAWSLKMHAPTKIPAISLGEQAYKIRPGSYRQIFSRICVPSHTHESHWQAALPGSAEKGSLFLSLLATSHWHLRLVCHDVFGCFQINLGRNISLIATSGLAILRAASPNAAGPLPRSPRRTRRGE